jgi:hypothetical protein
MVKQKRRQYACPSRRGLLKKPATPERKPRAAKVSLRTACRLVEEPDVLHVHDSMEWA